MTTLAIHRVESVRVEHHTYKPSSLNQHKFYVTKIFIMSDGRETEVMLYSEEPLLIASKDDDIEE